VSAHGTANLSFLSKKSAVPPVLDKKMKNSRCKKCVVSVLEKGQISEKTQRAP
jgi:hypothetical protein